MYTDDDFMTRRDRVSDSFIRQMLGESNTQGTVRKNTVNERSGCGGGCAQNDENYECTRGDCGSDGVGEHSWGLVDYPLASAYAPLQEWRMLYDNDMGLSRGTIFKELDLPFMGGTSVPTGACNTSCGGRRHG